MGLVSVTLEMASAIAAKARHAGEFFADVTGGSGGPGGPGTGGGSGGSGFGNAGALSPRSSEPPPNYGGWWDSIWTFLKSVNGPIGEEMARRHFGWNRFPSGGVGVDTAITVLTVTPEVAHAVHEADVRSDFQESTIERNPDPLGSSTAAYERKVQQRREYFARKFAQKAKQGGGQ